MNRLKGIILFFLFWASSESSAQDKYWVFFKDRDFSKTQPISKKTYENRKNIGLEIVQESDFGPKIDEILMLSNAGFKPQNTSRWFNAVSVYLTENDIAKVEKIPFVKGIKKITSYPILSSYGSVQNDEELYLSFPLHQINAGAFIERAWLGKGVDIGVIDGGFFDANHDNNLKHLFENQQIKGMKDFFSPPKVDFFGEKKSEGEIHGTLVTTYITGFNEAKKQVYGLAAKSNFYFARTESSQKEARIEEDNWIGAIEWLDSLGVRLVNSSLGYATGFTNPAESYKPEQMDGKTSLISQGARMAVNEKGMILVISAGNEGDNKLWGGIVSTPGDVEEVISVGANDEQGLRMSYSSKGVENMTFIKPDITVYSQYGTSLAAPIITGLIAGILEKKPNLTAAEVKELLYHSSSLAELPNNFVGHGIPDAGKIVEQLEGGDVIKRKVEYKKAKKSIEIKTTQEGNTTVFHKKDSRNVVSQELIKNEKGKIVILRPQNVKQTSVVLSNKLVEINWKN